MTKTNEKAVIKNLSDVKKVFDNNDIPFWLEYGTLLGAVRDGKMIPWDTDIDLATFKKYVNTKNIKKRLTEELEKMGFLVYFYPHTMNINRNKTSMNVSLWGVDSKKKMIVMNRFKKNDFLIRLLLKTLKLFTLTYYGGLVLKDSNGIRDLIKMNLFFLMKGIPEKFKKIICEIIEVLLYSYRKKEYCYLEIPEEYFLKLRIIDYHGVKVKIPEDSEKYLEKMYGDWKTPPKEPKKWIWYEHGKWKSGEL